MSVELAIAAKNDNPDAIVSLLFANFDVNSKVLQKNLNCSIFCIHFVSILIYLMFIFLFTMFNLLLPRLLFTGQLLMGQLMRPKLFLKKAQILICRQKIFYLIFSFRFFEFFIGKRLFTLLCKKCKSR